MSHFGAEKPYSPMECNIRRNPIGLLGSGGPRTYIVAVGPGCRYTVSLKLPIVEGFVLKVSTC